MKPQLRLNANHLKLAAIIAMTADAFSDDAQRCFECGMDAHLTKPLDIRECMRTLQKYLS